MGFRTKSNTSPTAFTPAWGNARGVSEGENIDHVEGRLVSIFDVKQAGKSTVQNGEIETPDGKIKIALWGTELPKSLKGKRICITAIDGDKWGQITYGVNSYSGRKGEVTEEVLSIGSKAEIEEIEGAPASGNAEQRTRPAQPQSTGSFTESIESLLEHHMIVDELTRLAYAKKDYDEETIRAYVASIWINADRAGYIVPGDRPLSGARQPSTAAAPAGPTQPDPQNWAEAIVPSGTKEGQTLGAVGKEYLKKLEAVRKQQNKQGPFWECVKQAALDLSWDDAAEETDDIPW